MTEREFANWTEETAASRNNWLVDEVTRLNSGRLLFYRGGEAGRYISIEPSGKLTMGEYEGAIPHIGEASFRPSFSRDFENAEAALARTMECAGAGFLANFMGVRF